MNSIFYSVIILLLLTGAILFLMWEVNKKRPGGKIVNLNQTEPMTKEEGEDIDFLHATIKRMTMTELNETPGLFDAQRRCSDLNSAVYKYYDNIKKRCLNGEKVPYSDLDVLNLRQCFREFSLEAYPALVALVWPEYQRPQVNPDEI